MEPGSPGPAQKPVTGGRNLADPGITQGSVTVGIDEVNEAEPHCAPAPKRSILCCLFSGPAATRRTTDDLGIAGNAVNPMSAPGPGQDENEGEGPELPRMAASDRRKVRYEELNKAAAVAKLDNLDVVWQKAAPASASNVLLQSQAGPLMKKRRSVPPGLELVKEIDSPPRDHPEAPGAVHELEA